MLIKAKPAPTMCGLVLYKGPEQIMWACPCPCGEPLEPSHGTGKTSSDG